MYIHLLSVSGSASEVTAKRSPINEDITSYDTNVLPLSKNIEAGGLSGTRGTHESGHGTGPDISVNLVEESKLSARNGDSIIDAFPSEGLAVGEGDLLVNFGSLLLYGLRALLLLAESRIELGGLFSLLGEEREADTCEGRTL